MRMRDSLIAGGLFGFVLLSVAPALPAAEVPAGLEPMGPVRCRGDEELEIRGRHISAADNAVEAAGRCEVEIYDSYIEAGAVGILASNYAEVELYNTHVEAGEAALVAENFGNISMEGCRIVGGTVTRNFGEIEDEGGNMVTGRATTSATAGIPTGDVTIGPEGVRVESGGSTVIVGDDRVRVEAGGQATEVTGDWRTGGTVYTIEDTERLLVELGATLQEGRLRLQMAGDILFDFDSAAIRPDAATELAKVAHVVRLHSEGTVSVVGHTDSIGDDHYNQRLSEQRARAVSQWLHQSEGIPLQMLEASGRGEKNPVAHNTMPDGSDNSAGRAQNRRVEVAFVARDTAALSAAGRVTAGPVGVRVESGAAEVRMGAGNVEVRERAAGTLPASCARICDAWSAVSEEQAGCVTASLELGGYAVLGTYACMDVETTGECIGCWIALDVSDGDCARIARSCLGG